MKRIIALLAATLLTLSLSGLAFAEEPKKDEAAAEVKKEVKKDKKDAAKDKKVEKKAKKKKKEAAGC